MIRYALRCDKDHAFEGWFRSGADYDRLAKAKGVACTVCGSVKVEKAIMAPSIGRAGKDKGAPAVPPPARSPGEAAPPTPTPEQMQLAADPRRRAMIEAMRELRKKITENADYVGDRFAEEARKIHYQEAEPRGIYGEATREEAEQLAEEGVEFAPLPPVPDDRN
ncbi:MAG: DUF1178 family protein [Rhizobiales bacterium]|nr:DUF1178 family protein [Hyphomicrobiales bacterium]